MRSTNEQLLEQVNEIFQRGVIVDLDISWWAGQAKLRAEDIGIPRENINFDLFSLGRKRFIPKNWIGRFRKFEQKGRGIVANYSFHYKRGGGYFVPLPAVEKMLKELTECRENFWRVVKGFKENYPRIKIKMIEAYRKETPKIWARLRNLGAKLPDVETFERRFMEAVKSFYPPDPTIYFRYTWSFQELTLPREFKLKAANIKKKLKSAELEKQKQRALIQKYNEGFEVQVNGFLKSVVKELRSATIELTEKVQKQIIGGTVTDRRLERLREFIERFRLLNFLNDSEVELALNDLRNNLEHTAEEYNTNEELEDALRGSLSKVIKIASKSGSQILANAFGRKRKVLRKKKLS